MTPQVKADSLTLRRFEPLLDPKATRHEDLKGNKHLVYYCKPRDPNFTHYKDLMMGKEVPEEQKPKILDTFTVSAV
jgi:hypothetical protein